MIVIYKIVKQVYSYWRELPTGLFCNLAVAQHGGIRDMSHTMYVDNPFAIS